MDLVQYSVKNSQVYRNGLPVRISLLISDMIELQNQNVKLIEESATLYKQNAKLKREK